MSFLRMVDTFGKWGPCSYPPMYRGDRSYVLPNLTGMDYID